MREAVLRITALFSYCGGPLFIAEQLKRHIDHVVAFLLTFLPVGFMVMGALCLNDMTRSRWSFAAVWAGRRGLYIVLAMHLYALACFARGARVSEPFLYYSGIAVGIAWSVVYLRASRRWRSSPDLPLDANHRFSRGGIAPS
jgi:hypothetical protein